MKLGPWKVAAGASIVALAGCGSAGDAGVTAGRSAATTSTSVTATTPTVAPTTSAVAPTTSTVASTTSTTSTTEVSTTTVNPVNAGWSAVESLPGESFPPCCGSNWSGSPSPVLPDSGEIPDGIYHASRVQWSADDPATLVIDVRRFEQCAVLPEGGCEPLPDGYEYQPDELGLSDESVRRLTITLDATVRVAVTGWSSDAVLSEASGTDLVGLRVALDAAYAEAIAAPFLAGGEPDAIVAGLQESPAYGFGPPSVPDFYGALVYSYDAAPPLLFQYAFEYTDVELAPIDPSAMLFLTSIEIDQGVMSLYFYAGYYP